MRNILILATLALAVSQSAFAFRLTEEQKENFFGAMHSFAGGSEFLSKITNQIIDSVNPLLKFSHAVKDSKATKAGDSFLACEACKASVYALDTSIRTKTITKALEQFAVLVCDTIEAQNTTVCPGAVTEMGDIIVPVLANFLLGPDYLCANVLNYCQKEFVELSQSDYVHRVLSNKPNFLENNDFVQNLYGSI